MKKCFLFIICCLLVSCAGSNYGANGHITGWILKADGTAPGSANSDATVYAEGASGYNGPRIYAKINPADGRFDLSINLGVSDVGPPVKYVTYATFDLYLQANGHEWSPDTTAIKTIAAFRKGIPVEAGRSTSVGEIQLDYFIAPSIWN